MTAQNPSVTYTRVVPHPQGQQDKKYTASVEVNGQTYSATGDRWFMPDISAKHEACRNLITELKNKGVYSEDINWGL
jgi:hypothetical protein